MGISRSRVELGDLDGISFPGKGDQKGGKMQGLEPQGFLEGQVKIKKGVTCTDCYFGMKWAAFLTTASKLINHNPTPFMVSNL